MTPSILKRLRPQPRENELNNNQESRELDLRQQK